jgi:threonyl-tRNA synthetase
LKIWPEAQFAAGPPVERFLLRCRSSALVFAGGFREDRDRDEKRNQSEHPFERVKFSRDEALSYGNVVTLCPCASDPEPSKFKLDIIEKHSVRPEKISLYRNGEFVDLCAGPHVMRTETSARSSSPTWPARTTKATKRTPSLQRVYGTAFQNEKWNSTITSPCSRKRRTRDHRKLGRELELFVFDDDVGPGLPMFLPRGAVIAEEIGKARERNRVRPPAISARPHSSHRPRKLL